MKLVKRSVAYLSTDQLIHQPDKLFSGQRLSSVEVILKRLAVFKTAAVHLWVTDLHSAQRGIVKYVDRLTHFESANRFKQGEVLIFDKLAGWQCLSALVMVGLVT